MRSHACISEWTSPTSKTETYVAASVKMKLHSAQNTSKTCLYMLFVFDLFQKKLVVELHDHEIKRSRHPPSAEPYKLISLVLPAYLNGVTQNVTN